MKTIDYLIMIPFVVLISVILITTDFGCNRKKQNNISKEEIEVALVTGDISKFDTNLHYLYLKKLPLLTGDIDSLPPEFYIFTEIYKISHNGE